MSIRATLKVNQNYSTGAFELLQNVCQLMCEFYHLACTWSKGAQILYTASIKMAEEQGPIRNQRSRSRYKKYVQDALAPVPRMTQYRWRKKLSR